MSQEKGEGKMNKTLKNILIAVLVLVIIGAAIGGYFIYRHNDTYIGAEAALNIALDDAGTTVNMIYSDDVEFEKTRHSAWYEVEFDTHQNEYDYIIDAVTGEILNSSIKPQDLYRAYKNSSHRDCGASIFPLIIYCA